ncbi:MULTISPECIES: hypothetical protein [Streptomyces]|uniref:hypothetical protein n=1 Tax=Streptomyces TaxID=1883 RepID=UPI001674E55D|nr:MULTISPECIES: hypothetical protein [Streptomyces]MBK3521189.1 hypothetical protein [Streptomyces sp. MBT70]
MVTLTGVVGFDTQIEATQDHDFDRDTWILVPDLKDALAVGPTPFSGAKKSGDPPGAPPYGGHMTYGQDPAEKLFRAQQWPASGNVCTVEYKNSALMGSGSTCAK